MQTTAKVKKKKKPPKITNDFNKKMPFLLAFINSLVNAQNW